MTRYTKRVREEAALICAIAASTPGYREAYGAVTRSLYGDGVSTYGRPAFDLALAAWCECQYAWSDESGAVDAEAHALLMSGWSPP